MSRKKCFGILRMRNGGQGFILKAPQASVQDRTETQTTRSPTKPSREMTVQRTHLIQARGAVRQAPVRGWEGGLPGVIWGAASHGNRAVRVLSVHLSAVRPPSAAISVPCLSRGVGGAVPHATRTGTAIGGTTGYRLGSMTLLTRYVYSLHVLLFSFFPYLVVLRSAKKKQADLFVFRTTPPRRL